MSTRTVVISLSRQREGTAATLFFDERGWCVKWAGEDKEAVEHMGREKPEFVITDSLAFSKSLLQVARDAESCAVCVICDPGDEVAAWRTADMVVVRPFDFSAAFFWVR